MTIYAEKKYQFRRERFFLNAGGQVVVEMAMIVPFMILCALGGTELTLMSLEAAKVRAATHEGAKIVSQAGVFIADCVDASSRDAVKQSIEKDFQDAVRQIQTDVPDPAEGGDQGNHSGESSLTLTGEGKTTLVNRLNNIDKVGYSKLADRQSLCMAIMDRTVRVLEISGIKLNVLASGKIGDNLNTLQMVTTPQADEKKKSEIKTCLGNGDEKICFVKQTWTEVGRTVFGEDGKPLKGANGTFYKMNVVWTSAGIEISVPYVPRFPLMAGFMKKVWTSKTMTILSRVEKLPADLQSADLIPVSPEACNSGGLGFGLGHALLNGYTYCQ